MGCLVVITRYLCLMQTYLQSKARLLWFAEVVGAPSETLTYKAAKSSVRLKAYHSKNTLITVDKNVSSLNKWKEENKSSYNKVNYSTGG